MSEWKHWYMIPTLQILWAITYYFFTIPTEKKTIWQPISLMYDGHFLFLWHYFFLGWKMSLPINRRHKPTLISANNWIHMFLKLWTYGLITFICYSTLLTRCCKDKEKKIVLNPKVLCHNLNIITSIQNNL